jgi:hypothetical protein
MVTATTCRHLAFGDPGEQDRVVDLRLAGGCLCQRLFGQRENLGEPVDQAGRAQVGKLSLKAADQAGGPVRRIDGLSDGGAGPNQVRDDLVDGRHARFASHR